MNNQVRLAPQSPLRAGMTVIEILVVVAVLGIIFAIGVPQFRTSPAKKAANSVQSFVQSAKFVAVRVNRPVTITLSADGRTMVSLVGATSTSVDCAPFGSVSPESTLDLSEYPRASLVSSELPFIWLPNGQPRLCGGHALPLTGVRTQFADSSGTHLVQISGNGVVSAE